MMNLAKIITFTATVVSNVGINNIHILPVVPPATLPTLDLPIFETTYLDTDTKTIPAEFFDSPVVEVVYNHIPVECAEDDIMCYSALAWNAFMIKSMKTYEKFISKNIQHVKCTFETIKSIENRKLIMNISLGYWRGIQDYCYALLALIAQKSVSILIFALMITLVLVQIVFWLSMWVVYIQHFDKQCPCACYYQTRVSSIVLFYIQIIGHALVQIKYQYNRMAWEEKIRNFGEKFSGFFRFQTTYSNNGNGTGRRDNIYIGQLNTEWENFHLFILEAAEKIPRKQFVFIDVVQYLYINLPSDPYFDEWRSYHEGNINMDVLYLSIKHQLLQTFCGDRVSQLNYAQQKVCRNMSMVLNYMFDGLELYYEQRSQNVATATHKFDSMDVVRASWIKLRQWAKLHKLVDNLYYLKDHDDISHHYLFQTVIGLLCKDLPSDPYFNDFRKYFKRMIGKDVKYETVKRQVIKYFHEDKIKHFNVEQQEVCLDVFKVVNNMYERDEELFEMNYGQDIKNQLIQLEPIKN